MSFPTCHFNILFIVLHIPFTRMFFITYTAISFNFQVVKIWNLWNELKRLILKETGYFTS